MKMNDNKNFVLFVAFVLFVSFVSFVVKKDCIRSSKGVRGCVFR